MTILIFELAYMLASVVVADKYLYLYLISIIYIGMKAYFSEHAVKRQVAEAVTGKDSFPLN